MNAYHICAIYYMKLNLLFHSFSVNEMQPDEEYSYSFLLGDLFHDGN